MVYAGYLIPKEPQENKIITDITLVSGVNVLDIDRLDLMHKVFLAMGPKVDKKLVKNLLWVVTILSDRDLGDELKQMVRRL
jgi:hypothetical protein